jgi:hypothetical protein
MNSLMVDSLRPADNGRGFENLPVAVLFMRLGNHLEKSVVSSQWSVVGESVLPLHIRVHPCSSVVKKALQND